MSDKNFKSNINSESSDYIISTNEVVKKHSHFGHRNRLRNMINNTDVLALPEHQILELLLTFILPQRDVNPLAHELLNEFGSLANVFEASVDDLSKVKGIGEVASNFLSFCSKIPEIYKNSKARTKRRLNTVDDVIDFLRSTIDFTSVEKFYYLCLNSKGDVLCFKSLGSGSVSQLYINNREFVHQILKYPTQTMVICHTHPHGDPKPSDEDRAFTNMIGGLLDTLSIRLCDHIILSPDGFYSFFQNHELGYGVKSNLFGNLKMSILSDSYFIYDSKVNKDSTKDKNKNS